MTPDVFYLERLVAPCGEMLIATDSAENLRALDWIDYEARMRRLLSLHYGADGVRLEERDQSSGVRAAIEDYLGGDLSAIAAIPVKTAGTPFQREVWKELRAIPPGTTTTYGKLAGRLGRSSAVRAVGAANGANPIALVVPCHRVVGADGDLTGYAGGLERKRWLLRHEGAAV